MSETTTFARLSRYLVPGVLVLGVVVSLLAFQNAKELETARFKQELAQQIDARLDARATSLASRIDACTETLQGLSLLIALRSDMDEQAFRTFARHALSRQPALETLQLLTVPASPGASPTVRYQETAGSAEPLPPPAGLEPILAKTRLSGRPILGGLVSPDGNPRNAAPGNPLALLICYVPGFSDSNTQTTSYLVAHCRLQHLAIANAPAGTIPGHWLLLDQGATDPSRRSLLYLNELLAKDTTPPSPPAETAFSDGTQREKSLTLAGRDWLLLFRPDPTRTAVVHSWTPRWILINGLLLSVLIAALLREWFQRARLIERQVNRRTITLQETQQRLEDDIRRRQQTEELLRASEQQLNSLMENSPGAIYVKDVDGRYLAVNRRFTQLHGRSRDDFIGRSDFELFPPEIAQRVRKSDAQVMASTDPVEMEESFQLVDGVHVNLVHKFPLIDTAGAVHGVCAIASDITERKRAEAEVRESRRQVESLLGQLPGMAFRFSNDGRLTPVYVSRGAAGLTGHTARDFLEKHISLEEIIHPDDRQMVRAAISAAVKKRRSFEVEYRLIDRAGREKWVLERGQGIHDEFGALLFIEGLAIDITQRKDAESEKLLVERRLLEGQKLESIGVLAGGIAHDFNNLLTGIIGNANLASLDLPPQSPIRNNLRQIEIASQRAAELCQQMLAYAGKGRFIIQPVEIGQLVKSTVPLLQASISKRAKLRFELEADLPAVQSDPTQMRQIIMNLVINASEALGEKDGEIALTTNLVRPASDWFEGAALAPPDINQDFVRLEVRDTGSGMSSETLAKIFEPFFTTKFTGRGLGLAAVLGIIRSHKGGLLVRSAVGKGSTFAIFFPADPKRRIENAPSRNTTNTPWQRSGHVLVVDDEPHVLKVATGMLMASGMTFETACDGYEALDFYRANPDRFNLVLLDMTMPRLSGEETLQQLREIRPNVRVLFMSGYNRREVVDALPGRNTLGFMQKPFTLSILRENLQIMLG
ncbi:MAG: PAS domain S-box protein [Nibricoccus sp.]